MTSSALEHLTAVVDANRAVVSADDATIVAIVKDTINSGRTATFYLSAAQSEQIRSWFFTPQRLETMQMAQVTRDEAARITSELGIENVETFRCNQIQCGCGRTYGAFEFLKQGVREHGPDIVRAVFAQDNFAMVNANRTLVTRCDSCSQVLSDRNGGFTYDCDHYGGCCYEEV